MNMIRTTIMVREYPVSILRSKTRGTSGKRVLFLHGWGSRSEAYRDFFKTLPDDLADFAVPDIPGFGETPPFRIDSAWGVYEYAAWVRDLLDALGWHDPVIVAGHSFGGQIAAAVAHDAPDRVSGLVLYAAAVVRPPHRIRRSVATVAAVLLRPLYRFRRYVGFLAGLRDWHRTPAAMKPVMERVIRQDLTHLLPDIHQPAVVLWGEHDRKTPLAHGRHIAEHMPNAELRIIKGAGHSLRMDAPDRFSEEIVRAIKRLS